MLSKLGCVIGLAAALALPGWAANYYVDVDYVGGGGTGPTDPFQTIAAAVTAANAATGPHNIYIAGGVYAHTANGGLESYNHTLTQRISFHGGYAGWDGASALDWTEGSRVPRSTIIDLKNAGVRAFYRDGASGSYDGLTFRDANLGSGNGGAIFLRATSQVTATIRNCLFTNNVTAGEGGAVHFAGHYTHLVIEDSDFVDNSALRGGAVRLYNEPPTYADSRGSITVRRSTFTGNNATEYGGAVEVPGGGPFTIEDCRFDGNVAGTHSGALRFNSQGHIFTARRNTFLENTSVSGAAAVRLSNNSTFTMDNCLFAANTGPYTVEVSNGSLTMRHCTIATNAATTAALFTSRPLTLRNTIIVSNGPHGIQRSGSNTADVDYNLVWGHTTADYDNVTPGGNSLSEDPKLTDAPNGDFRLLRESSCIDAGIDLGITHDLDNNPRPARDGYDIGCYEEWQMPVILNRAELAESDNVTLRAEFTYESEDIATDAWLVLDTTEKGTGAIGDWWQSANSGEQVQGVVFDQAFSSLSPDTTYYWRCVGSNDYEVTWGPLGTFKTPPAGGVTRVWTGLGGNALASTGGNWLGGTAPTANDYVMLDTSVLNMTWDAGTAGLPETVARWTQTENYTGTVTFNTVYGTSGFTNFTVTSDCRVLRGTWQHVANTSGSSTQDRCLRVTVGGDFTLGAPATINANGLGFSGYRGPGRPAGTGNSQHGAAHGGHGALMNGPGPSGAIYGSVNAPTTLGSGGGRGDTPNARGGGAIVIAVTGDAVIDGTMTANGVFAGDTNGSGGSVNLTARTLSGAGLLRANGGSGSYADSGGGRVAVKLTQTGADFSAFNGSMIAYGGSRGFVSGAAGTVYRQTGDQADGQGSLIIDNGNRLPYLNGIATVVPSGVNLNDFAEIVLLNRGVLGVVAGDTLDLGLGHITSTGVDNSYITLMDASGVTFPNAYTISGYTLVLNAPVVATGNWTVAADGAMTHGENYRTEETFKLDLTLTGNLTVDGTINVNRKGFRGGYGPGRPTAFYGGPSYGGIGGFGGTGTTLANCGPTYGSIVNPVNVGSGGGRTDGSTRAGGGAVILDVSGHLAVNGSIRSESESEADTVGSGGSINITAGTIGGAGPISANASFFYQGGGGGRVAVRLTDPNADFSAYSGAITAFGGVHSAPGAAGTVYREAAGLDPSPQVRVINYTGANTQAGVVTPLPPSYDGSDPAFQFNDDLSEVFFDMLGNAKVTLTGNVTVGALSIAGMTVLDLNGYTITVVDLLVVDGVEQKWGNYPASAFSQTIDSDPELKGLIHVVPPPPGTLMLLR